MTDRINQARVQNNNYQNNNYQYSEPKEFRRRSLNQLAEPIVNDFVNFTNKIEQPKGNLLERIAIAGARQFELVGGLVRIGNTIEEDRLKGDDTYKNSRYEIARYSTTQTAGVALGGLGLVVGGIVLGPIGLITGAAGYFVGNNVGGRVFDYVVSKLGT